MVHAVTWQTQLSPARSPLRAVAKIAKRLDIQSGNLFTLGCSSSAGMGSPAATVCCAFPWPPTLFPHPLTHSIPKRYHCWTAAMAWRTSEGLRPAPDLPPGPHFVLTRQFVCFRIEVGGFGLSQWVSTLTCKARESMRVHLTWFKTHGGSHWRKSAGKLPMDSDINHC